MDFFAAGADDPHTWMRRDDPQPTMAKTDELPELPPCKEMMATATFWDPYGARWGRGAHWPLLAIIGTRRTRTPLQKQKRRVRDKAKWEKTHQSRKAPKQAEHDSAGGTASSSTPAKADENPLKLIPAPQSPSSPSPAWESAGPSAPRTPPMAKWGGVAWTPSEGQLNAAQLKPWTSAQPPTLTERCLVEAPWRQHPHSAWAISYDEEEEEMWTNDA